MRRGGVGCSLCVGAGRTPRFLPGGIGPVPQQRRRPHPLGNRSSCRSSRRRRMCGESARPGRPVTFGDADSARSHACQARPAFASARHRSTARDALRTRARSTHQARGDACRNHRAAASCTACAGRCARGWRPVQNLRLRCVRTRQRAVSCRQISRRVDTGWKRTTYSAPELVSADDHIVPAPVRASVPSSWASSRRPPSRVFTEAP